MRVFSFWGGSAQRTPTVQLMYFGRVCEMLQMTGERLPVPAGGCTLELVLAVLRSRGEQWARELDERQCVCTVGGEPAHWTMPIAPGMEIAIYSNKSLFEP